MLEVAGGGWATGLGCIVVASVDTGFDVGCGYVWDVDFDMDVDVLNARQSANSLTGLFTTIMPTCHTHNALACQAANLSRYLDNHSFN